MTSVDLIKRERNTKNFQAGDVIFNEGDGAKSFYVVEQGEVEITSTKRVLEMIGPDGFFGEMGLVNQKPRSASATAKTDCTLIEINEGDFYFLIQHAPMFAIKMMQVLSERVRRNIES